MPKINYLNLELHSRTEVNEKIAREILEFIYNYADGSMQPEKYGLFEPLKEKFDKKDLSKLIKWLSVGSGFILFKRVKTIRYNGGIDDLRPSPYPILIEGDNERILQFPHIKKPKILTKVILWIDLNHIKKKPKDFIEDFFKQFFLKLNCEFGFLTLVEDYNNKNHLVKKTKNGTFETYIGQNLEKEGIPGLYWINIFGKSYVEWFGKNKLDKIECWKKEKLDNGSILLQFCEKADYCLTNDILKQQEKTKKILNEKAFFDIRYPNRKVVILPLLIEDDK